MIRNSKIKDRKEATIIIEKEEDSLVYIVFGIHPSKVKNQNSCGKAIELRAGYPTF